MHASSSDSVMTARHAAPITRHEATPSIAQFGGVRVVENKDHFLIAANWATRSGEAARLAIRDAREFHGIWVGFNGRSHMLPKQSVEDFCRALADDQRPSVVWLRQHLAGEAVSVPTSAAYTLPELTNLAHVAPSAVSQEQLAQSAALQTSLFSPYGVAAPAIAFEEIPVAASASELPQRQQPSASRVEAQEPVALV